MAITFHLDTEGSKVEFCVATSDLPKCFVWLPYTGTNKQTLINCSFSFQAITEIICIDWLGTSIGFDYILIVAKHIDSSSGIFFQHHHRFQSTGLLSADPFLSPNAKEYQTRPRQCQHLINLQLHHKMAFCSVANRLLPCVTSAICRASDIDFCHHK